MKREGLLSIRADGYGDVREAIVNGELLVRTHHDGATAQAEPPAASAVED
jgi:hypothetical protein